MKNMKITTAIIFSLLLLFIADFAVAKEALCPASVISVLSKKTLQYQVCIDVDKKHFLLLHPKEDSLFLDLSVFSKGDFSLESKPLSNLSEVAQSLGGFPGKDKAAENLKTGYLITDLSGDGSNEIILLLNLELGMSDLAIVKIDEQGRIKNFSLSKKAEQYFLENNPADINSLKVMRMDATTTIDISSKKHEIVLGDTIHKNFKFKIKLTTNGQLDVEE